jgi:capsular polysaccharide biosynthesis protein
MDTLPKTPEDGVDLRRYVRLVAGNWLWVLVPAVLGIVGSFLAVMLLPRTYEATALITPNRSVGRPFLQLATSDEFVRRVLDRLPYGILPDNVAPSDLQKGLLVQESGPFLVLKVRSQQSDSAAAIANEWADVTIESLNAARDLQVPYALLQGDRLVAAAHDTWLAALQDWITSDARMLQKRLGARESTLLLLLADLGGQDILLRELGVEVLELRGQLSLADPVQEASHEAQITLEVLARGATGAEPAGYAGGRTATWNIGNIVIAEEGDDAYLTNRDAIVITDDLLVALSARRRLHMAQQAALESELARIEAELDRIELEQGDLTISRSSTERWLAAVEGKKIEEILAQQPPVEPAEVASKASAPSIPYSPRPWRDGALAGIVGALIGLGGLLLRDWLTPARGAPPDGLATPAG